ATTGGQFYYPFNFYMSYYNNAPDVWLNNIVQSTGAIEYGFFDYMYSPKILSGVSSWDNGDTLFDGNDYLQNDPNAYYDYYVFQGATYTNTTDFLSAAR